MEEEKTINLDGITIKIVEAPHPAELETCEAELAKRMAEQYYKRMQAAAADNVNSPNHYKLDGLDIEVIDVIRSVLSEREFEAYCLGNVIKYVLRAKKKNGKEDLKKARVYINWITGDGDGKE
uniref:DUF3310 domain-containing protein n=1 Tax=uncultured bacterium Contig643 TaxID=1393602 RepID=W0FKQ7_9BACT|nr:predicted protein [uncultured bacterium Contig643]